MWCQILGAQGSSTSLAVGTVEDAVQLCLVAAGKTGAVAELDLLLRSVRATSVANISVHVIVSPETKVPVAKLLKNTRWAWQETSIVEVTDEALQHVVAVWMGST